MKLLLTLLIGFIGLTSMAASDTITLTSKNTVVLRNEVSPDSMNRISLELSTKVAARGTQSYPIYLVLDSPGGEIMSGLDFIEFAKTIPNLETITIFSASMAAGIVEALPGKRHITENGILMFHRARGGVDGQFENGELESRLDFYKRLVRGMEIKNATRLKTSLEVYKTKVVNEMWMLGIDAVTQNGADDQVNVVCAPELIKGSVTEKMQIFIFSVQVKYSACPLLRTGVVTAPQEEKATQAYNEYRKSAYPTNKN